MNYDSVILISVALVIVTLIAAGFAARKDGPSVLGAAGIIIAIATIPWWLSVVPLWISIVVALASGVLFTIGILVNEAVDRRWHVAALVTGLFGQLLVALVVLIWGWLMTTDHFAIPRIVWVGVVLAIVTTIAVRWWRHR